MTFDRPILAVAAVFGAIGVALAALGSHSGDTNTTIAATFLQLHGAALVGLSLLPPRRTLRIGTWLLAFGTLLFAGDLLARSYLSGALFPMAAPMGGGSMILAWLIIAVSALVAKQSD